MGNKSDKAEIARRVEAVRMLILDGLPSSRIVQNVTATLKVKPRQAENYIRKARAQINELWNDSPAAKADLKAEHIAVRRDIRKRARGAGDYRAELAAAQDEAKLFGLYPAERLEHTGADGQPIEIHDGIRAALYGRLSKIAVEHEAPGAARQSDG